MKNQHKNTPKEGRTAALGLLTEDNQSYTAARGDGDAGPWQGRTHRPWAGDEDDGVSQGVLEASQQKADPNPALLGGKRASRTVLGPGSRTKPACRSEQSRMEAVPKAGGLLAFLAVPHGNQRTPEPARAERPGAACLCLPWGCPPWDPSCPTS